MDKFVVEFPNVLTEELCQSIVNRFENDTRKTKGYFYYRLNGELVTRDKTNMELSTTGVEGWQDIEAILHNKCWEVFNEYMRLLKHTFDYGVDNHVYDRELNDSNNMYNTNFPIQRIDEGGSYEWHHDGNSTKTYFVQLIFYLNTLEDHQGGCTEFVNGRKVKPEAGKVLVYPCSWTFPHTGAEVKHGSKYITTTTIGFVNPTP